MSMEKQQQTEPIRGNNHGLKLGAIWAQTTGRVIAANGEMPWDVPEDFAHFKASTLHRPVIMGRASWLALPKRPLPQRLNIVLSRSLQEAEPGMALARDLDEAYRIAAQALQTGEYSAHENDWGVDAWITGGGQVYAESLPQMEILVVSEIEMPAGSDTEQRLNEGDPRLVRAPQIDPEQWEIDPRLSDTQWRQSRRGAKWRILTYRRKS